jgi:peptide/nickel transport system substrate-binding protein
MRERGYWGVFAARLSRRRLLSGAGVAAVGVTSLAGCAGNAAPTAAPPTAPPPAAGGGSPAAAAAPATPTAAAKYGGTYTLDGGKGVYPNLDPHQSSSSALFGLGLGLAYNRVLKLKLQGVEMPAYIPVPDLAEGVDQPDDTTYVFRLRRGVKFHNIAPVNGREFVADDAVYSYNRQLDQKVNGAVLQGIAKMETPDRYTLKLTAAAPDADFLLAIAAPQSLVVAKEAVDLHGDLKEGPVVGTGAFVLEKADRAQGVYFAKNPDYFVRGQPYIDRWQEIWVADYAQELEAAKAGKFDSLVTVPEADAEGVVRANPKMATVIGKGFGSGLELALNLKAKPFDDERVRKAVYKAIDPQGIIDTVAGGQGFHTVGMPLPGSDWAIPQDEIKQTYKRDVEGARKLLADAGLGAGFDFELSVTNVLDTIPPTGELIQQWLKDVNVRAGLKVIDFPTYTQLRQRGPYEGLLGTAATQVSASAALTAKWQSGGALNSTGLADPALDKMIGDQGRLVRDPAARKRLLLDIQRYILDHAYMHMIWSFEETGLVAKRVHDYVPGAGILNLESDRWAFLWLDS